MDIKNEKQLDRLSELPVIELEKPKPKIKIEKFVMPPTSEIFVIKDLGDKKLVIKKDGTKLLFSK